MSFRAVRKTFQLGLLGAFCTLGAGAPTALGAGTGQPTAGEPTGQTGDAPPRLVVVVNKKNPIKTLTVHELRRIFLRKLGRWPNGWKITVLERHSENPIRKAFATGVLKKNLGELKKYWIDLKLSRGMKQPKVCASTKLLGQYLKRVKGGIGYVYEHEVDKDLQKIVNVKGLDAAIRAGRIHERKGTEVVEGKDR